MKKIILTSIILLFIISMASAASDTVTIITAEEGAMKDATPGLYEVGRVHNTGPEIKIISPELADEYNPPVNINIVFEPTDDDLEDMMEEMRGKIRR